MGRLQERIQRRRESKVAALEAAVEYGHALCSDDRDFRAYLLENDATPEQADELVRERRQLREVRT